MGPQVFLNLCALLEREVAKTLYTLTHSVKNREVQFWFRRLSETTSRHLHRVLRAIIEVEGKFLLQPDGSEIPPEITLNNRFYPYFKFYFILKPNININCICAIDGIHIRVKVSCIEAPKYRGRKDYPTQNVLTACSFDLKFTY
ncbi:hypothetical protein RJ641_017569, partial [Dillenia turbinata]